MSRAGSGVRNETSFFLELRRVDLAASETLLQDFQGACCYCCVAFVLVGRTALATALAAVATVLPAAFAFGFGLRLNFLHYLSPVMPGMVRLDVARDLRNAVGCRRNDAGSGDELRRFARRFFVMPARWAS